MYKSYINYSIFETLDIILSLLFKFIKLTDENNLNDSC